MPGTAQFRSSDEIELVVRRFESCDFAKGEFTHAFHLTVAAWYCSRSSPEAALERMRAGLVRLTQKFGVKAYHETITRFWIQLVSNRIMMEQGKYSLGDSVNSIISAYASKDIIYEHYSRDLLLSDFAKSHWVEPDLKPMDRSDSGNMYCPNS